VNKTDRVTKANKKRLLLINIVWLIDLKGKREQLASLS